jgi:hypothetical protein
MSCDNWTYSPAIVELVAYSNLDEELGDYATTRETAVETDNPLKRCRSEPTADQSKAHRDETRARIIADTTHVCPQYVWGDEGPIND